MEQESNSVCFPLQNPNTLKIHSTAVDDDRHKRIIGNLKASIFAKINPSITIMPELETHIEQRLLRFFPSFHTPSHPPYSSMIQRAILELNDEEGSTEEAISGFIRREYKDLPWGHESFMKHHLIKLCGNKEIACLKGRYLLLVKDSDHKEIKGSSTKKQGCRGKRRRNRGKVKKIEKQIQREKKQIKVSEESRDLEMLPVEVTELKIEAPGQHNSTLIDNKYNPVITKLKKLAFEMAAKPSKTVSTEVKSNIEQRLQEFFPNFHTLTHPPYATETPHAVEVKQHNDQMATLERDARKLTFNKQPGGQSVVSATNSFDMRMESVKKTKRFEEQLLGFSLSFRGMESSNSVTGKRKELPKEQQMQTRTSCSECVENLEMKSSIEVTEVQKQHQKREEEVIWECSHLQGQHIDVITKVSVSCCDGGVECRESEEKRLQTKSPREQRELVSGLMARQHPQLKNLTGQELAAKSYPVELSSFLELQTDQEQHLDLSSMEQSPKPETNVNKSIIISSPSDPQHQYEQLPPKRRGRRRQPRLKPDANMITKSLLPSSDHGCNEQQQQLEDEGKRKFPAPNLVADATI